MILKLPFLNLHLSIINVIVAYTIYDQRDDLNFEKVSVPFLDVDVPLFPSYIVCVFLCILFVLREYFLMLVTSKTETNFSLLSKVIYIMTLVKHFLYSTTDTHSFYVLL